MKLRVWAAVTAAVLAIAGSASAGPISGTYTLGGNTVNNGNGTFTLTATANPATFSVLRYVFDTPVTFGSLTNLSLAYDAQLGGIGGGSPRFAVVLNTGDFFVINLGPPGSFVDPTPGPGNTGNLLALTDVGRYDLSPAGGSPYTDRAAALALFGNSLVTRISLITDTYPGSPGGESQRFVVNGDGFALADNSPVPEPATCVLFGGLVAVGGLIARRRLRAA
jgi:hypothetical protein